jgi:Leucine-rich repeat (LRR) protein
LDLSQLGITECPNLGNLSSLTSLNLSGNVELAVLPQDLSPLSSLVELDVSKTALNVLPDSIGSLHK